MEGIACILGSIFAAAALVCTYMLVGYVLRARERERKLRRFLYIEDQRNKRRRGGDDH